MTKKEKFNVTVATFEKLLSQNKLWREYYANIGEQNVCMDEDKIYTSWKEWALSVPPYQWVASAFIWDKTPQENETWMHFDYIWLQWICRNLNK